MNLVDSRGFRLCRNDSDAPSEDDSNTALRRELNRLDMTIEQIARKHRPIA
jgi:hypothetical protein